MRAAIITEYNKPLSLEIVPDPVVPRDGLVMKVHATGVCRSDWHTWAGHFPGDIALPLIPGHEMAGEVAEVGPELRGFKVGDRITVPFVLACGRCPICLSGNHQSCDDQIQPATDFDGSFAEYVALPRADVNAAHLPNTIGFAEAASLGCRFITAYRAVVEQGAVLPGHWIAVHGCGGVGLSAVMVAHAVGALAIAVDVDDTKLARAREIGAVATVNARDSNDVPAAIREITKGGAHASIDALGSTTTCRNSVLSLRTMGRHVQVGLMKAEHAEPAIPMGPVVSKELAILGSHGMSPKNYPELFRMIETGIIRPGELIGEELTLAQGAELLTRMDSFPGTGVSVITSFA